MEFSEQEQAWLFLREFTREILSNTAKFSLKHDIHSRLQRIDKRLILKEINEKQPVPLVSLTSVSASPAQPAGQTQPTGSDLNDLNLSSLNEILKDEEIYIIECDGPDKFLISKKPGKVENSNIKLSEDEIKKVIAEFSSKSKSYPSQGVLDVTYKNFSITAVMSDLAGSRFVLTRYLDPKKLIAEADKKI